MKKIAIIPARSGSKGLPNKNILLLGDKPLMAYTIEAALESKCFDKVIVSTDSLEYKYIAEQYGAEVILRNEYLSNDEATSFMVIKDVLEKVDNYDYFVLLQPTSPFRNKEHIKECIKIFENKYEKYNFLVSMEEVTKSSKLIQEIDADMTLKNYEIDFSNYRRQQYKEYVPNGAIFIGKVKNYLEQKHFFSADSIAYFMSKEDSVDIDDQIDFELAITLMARKNKKEIILKNVLEQIKRKEFLFKNPKEITLIGHSIIDRWDIHTLRGNLVNNLGISGITTQYYIKYILENNKINMFGNYIYIMLGINDFLDKKQLDDDIINNIEDLIYKIRNINKKSEIFFLEILSVYHRVDKDKERIIELNKKIKNRMKKINVKFVELNKYMSDEFNNLNYIYTDDGLHLNINGYLKLENILNKEK
ncbi:cytidylyltransferase domain-containing protein [Actinobacillus delphinicola]|uniref:N-acylneuraminate cytidylyltransferase n=1 Tax=Actinobacillus delphinicola TaxID=51161 RepID=A0A448TV79_9PAST|nr:GDSL-type esterase/lipase family protein [Actinobacillus delphinicola]VEJ09830.1 N-acylneuraminate cytidylyltransferase [Actinobacillus delphinicola]